VLLVRAFCSLYSKLWFDIIVCLPFVTCGILYLSGNLDYPTVIAHILGNSIEKKNSIAEKKKNYTEVNPPSTVPPIFSCHIVSGNYNNNMEPIQPMIMGCIKNLASKLPKVINTYYIQLASWFRNTKTIIAYDCGYSFIYCL
jgi:hypothetical protein